MKKKINLVLAGVAILLGLILALVPTREASISIESLQSQIQQTPDRVTPYQIAQWIIEGRNDFAVLDLRTAEAFEHTTISGALSVPITEIVDFITSKRIKPQEQMLFLLGESEAEAAQAALLLKSSGYKTYIIQDGYQGWVRMLQPSIPDTLTSREELRALQKKQTVAAHLRGDGAIVVPEVKIVKPELPDFKASPRKKATSEGC